MRIDKAGGNDLAFGVDFLPATRGYLANRNDFTGFDCDIGLERIAAAAVDHRAATDDKVCHDQNPSLFAIPP